MGIIKKLVDKIKQVYKHNPLRFITYTVVGCVAVIPAMLFILIFINLAKNDWSLNSMYFNGIRPTLIVTNSMEPVIMTNGIIIVEDVDPSEIELGDIIRYNSARGFSIVHRVVAIDMSEKYFITKGDNNKLPDSEIVYPHMVNGRVSDIHNEYSTVITAIIGKVDINNWSRSIARALFGVIVAALILAGLILLLYAIFEIITINHFWLKRKQSMIESNDWMDDLVNRNKFSNLVDRYREQTKNCGILKKLWMSIIFMKYYDILCTVEKHSKRANKWENYMNKLVDSNKD